VHPESDSFSYIKHIVLALHSLSQVHRAMDTLSQRLPLEVYQLVDKTINEIEGRHSIDLRNFGRRQRTTFDGSGRHEASSEVLADMLWTLYSKLAGVLSGHRIVHDCVLAIIKESKNKDNLTDMPEYNYIEVWKPIQSEVQ
jgi:exocyst complex component 4